jgi:methyl-accepting chemotaxis protein
MNRLLHKSGLTLKFVTPTVLVTLIVLIIGSMLMINSVEHSTSNQIGIAQQALHTEEQSAETALMASLKAKIDLIGKYMARTAPDLILAFDFTSLESNQEQAEHDSDIVYSAYLKQDKSPLSNYKKPKDNSNILELEYPIQSEGKTIGYVLIGASTNGINQQLKEAQSHNAATLANLKSEGDSSVKKFMGIASAVCIIAGVMIVAVLFFLFRALVIKPLQETGAVFEQMSNGDLTVSLNATNDDEIGYMKKCINKATDRFRNIIKVIANEIDQLNYSAGSLHELSDELSQNSEQQLKDTTQVATSMTEMISTTQEVARSANAAAESTEQAASAAEEGKHIVSQSVTGINALAHDVITAAEVIQKLQEDSGNIGTVLDVIKSIAEQTNLLALNAAIEAARAGEQGRGFAVVADEVRTLAGRTQQSTQEIQEMIERLQGRASDAVEVIEKGRSQADTSVSHAAKAGDSLESITHAVTTINDMNTQIASASEQQTAMAEDVNQSIININSVSEKATTSAENTSMASRELAALASKLAEAVSQFRT